ncbi:MAG TPA: enoyl-CoA hydratase/isomerase family protein [Coxiellaceae bacterium]|nr:enoyl-CoA hydratase/isomerase family protein [Coxiellaceae bacterium]
MVDIHCQEVANDHGSKTGVITLSRSSALNALTFDMLHQIRIHLERWEQDSTIQGVVVHSDSARAFCAGGDVKALYYDEDVLQVVPHPYFELEYELNRYLFHYPKPYVALMAGLTMGGGVGISLHGSHPVVFDSTQLAMPEAKIGFFVDVGVTYHLSRLPHHLGRWMAVTGLAVDADDCLALGLSSHKVSMADYDQLLTELTQSHWGGDPHHGVDQVLSRFAQSAENSSLMQQASLIESCFDGSTVDAISCAVMASDHAWLESTQKALAYNAPVSMQLALLQLERARLSSFDQVIDADLMLVQQCLTWPDFKEGVRAALIDKDRSPNWQMAPDISMDVLSLN